MRLKYLLLCLCGSATLFAGTISWENDYKMALKRGVEEKKPLLLFFSGSDWSGWSMKMKKEVFSDPLFIGKTGESFVFVEVDFPSSGKPSESALKANEELQRKFHILEFPRLLMIDENEREIARFSPESAETLASELTDILAKRKSLDEMLSDKGEFSSDRLSQCYKLALEVKDERASALLEKGMKSEDPLFFLTEKYRLLSESGRGSSKEAQSLREHLIALDPNNVKKVHLSLALIDFQTRECAQKLDRKEVIRPLEEYLAKFGEKDSENRWRLEMMVAQYYLNYDQSQEALNHAEMAVKCAPEEHRQEVCHTADYIRKQAHLTVHK